MNILMLSVVDFPRVNRVSSSIRTCACALAAMGHRITLVAPDYGSEHNDPHDHDFEVIRLLSRTIFFDPEDRLLKSSALRSMLPALPALAPRHWDLIHIHTPFRTHTLGVRLAKRAGRPTVESYHTYFEEYVAHYLPWLPSPLLRLLARRVSRKLCHDIDHLIVPSKQMVDVLEGYGINTHSTVLPTGLALGEFVAAMVRFARNMASKRRVRRW